MPRRTQDSAKSLLVFVYGAITLCRLPFQVILLTNSVLYCGPTTPIQNRFGLLPFRSPLLRESISLSFPPPTKMFQFGGLSSIQLCIHCMITIMVRFPHSDTPGSKITSISPSLFAGSRVLHLQLVPSHPPHALHNFSYFFNSHKNSKDR